MKNNEILDFSLLDDYLSGRLEPQLMHQIERISLDDPFVEQALAGLAESHHRNQTLTILQKRLAERIEQAPIKRKMWNINTQRLSIAAAASVLLIAITILFWMRENLRNKKANTPQQAQVEVEIKPSVVNPSSNSESAVSPKPSHIPTQASEVTPTSGDSFAVAPNETAPEPIGGWLKYQQYLESHNPYAADGEKMVELGFQISPDGKPQDIVILNGQSVKLNQEAIRLLSTGPLWKYQSRGKNKATLIVKF